MKKFRKIVFRLFLFLIVLLLVGVGVIAYYKKDIVAYANTMLQEKVDADIAIADVGISIFKHFPKATFSLEKMHVVNYAPFEGDTLLSVKSVDVVVPMNKLLQIYNDNTLEIEALTFIQPRIAVQVNKAGVTNYDIVKKSTETNTEDGGVSDSSEEGSVSKGALRIDAYNIEDGRISYVDKVGKVALQLDPLDLHGEGDFGAKVTNIITAITTKVYYSAGKEKVVDGLSFAADATIAVDWNTNTFTFAKNEFKFNDLPLVFDGFIQPNEAGALLDVHFQTPNSNFSNFIGILPEKYRGEIQDIQTKGTFSLDGKVKGRVTEDLIPSFDFVVLSKDAWVQYPNVATPIENIQIDARVSNRSGKTEDTEILLNTIAFEVAENTFETQATIKDMMTNMKVTASMKGDLDLKEIQKAFPVPMASDLQGQIKADMHTAFDAKSLEEERYENIESDGQLAVRDFLFNSEELAKPLLIKDASVVFNPQKVQLERFDAQTGNSDLKATGYIDNIMEVIFKGADVKGVFDLNADRLDSHDFMSETVAEESRDPQNKGLEKTTEVADQVKIPSFLDCTVNASVKEMIYDDITLDNVVGTLLIKDQSMALRNMKTDVFDGKLLFDGVVSTKREVSTFDMDMKMESFDITKSFKYLEVFQLLAPLAEIVEGKLNSDFNLSGDLHTDFTPDLKTISGKALTEILSTGVDINDSKAITALNSKLPFLNLDKVNFNRLITQISFENGAVKVKPFDVKYKDITMTLSGEHSFSQLLHYQAVFDVPTKYLGEEGASLLSNLQGSSASATRTIPVKATIGGTFDAPVIQTDLKSSISSMTNQIIEEQKDKLVNQGKDIANDAITNALEDVLGGKDPKDSTATDPVKGAVNQVLDEVLGGNKPKDSTETKDKVNDALNNAVNNIFGKKKKKNE